MTNDWLPRALEESRARGFLGPGPIAPQITHAEGFARCWESLRPDSPRVFVDLGSGGGLPGLVLLARWSARGILIDSMGRRTAFLREVLLWPEAPSGGSVEIGRAEELARREDLDSLADLVTSRSFGPPAVTAECAVRFLKVGGLLVVSEPPVDDEVDRWPADGLSRLGMVSRGYQRHEAGYQVLEKVGRTPEQFPRAIGIPGKRPLF